MAEEIPLRIPVHKDISTLTHYEDGAILSKVLLKTGKKDVTLFCMAGGTSLSEHTSSREAMVHVIEGRGTFTLEGEAIRMHPGTAIFMGKNQKHAIRAGTNMSFILILT